MTVVVSHVRIPPTSPAKVHDPARTVAAVLAGVSDKAAEARCFERAWERLQHRSTADPQSYPPGFTQVAGEYAAAYRAARIAAEQRHTHTGLGGLLVWSLEGVLAAGCAIGLLRVAIAATVWWAR